MLVTGAAGFIGFHLCRRLLSAGFRVKGIDNLNSYYDPALKLARLDILQQQSKFDFQRLDISDRRSTSRLSDTGFDAVVHLAAQAGVRYSLDHPDAYVDSNLVGFANVLELVRAVRPAHFVFASSSSVYGNSREVPFSTRDRVDHPVSIYAATKKANELLAHSYAHLFSVPTTGLRFFTVYGPWGRPDMAYYSFASAILAGRPIKLFNHGDLRRDFTYVDDVIEGVVRILPTPPRGASGTPGVRSETAAPFRVFNIGRSQPVKLLSFVETLEAALGRVAIKKYVAMQPGDVVETFADVSGLESEINYRPKIELEEGISRFVDWYLTYHGISRG